MSHHEYSVERRRNYEIEHDLSDIFGVEHVISEWCPFNGIYSSWADHCPISELRQIVDENIGKGIVDHYNLDYLANYAEGIINKREGIL